MSNRKTYLYIIDLDERGSFLAHVEDELTNKEVFTIKAGDQTPPDESSIFDDGVMRHKDDIERLESHLKELFIIEPYANIVKGN